jgi:hypothetical protein
VRQRAGEAGSTLVKATPALTCPPAEKRQTSRQPLSASANVWMLTSADAALLPSRPSMPRPGGASARLTPKFESARASDDWKKAPVTKGNGKGSGTSEARTTPGARLRCASSCRTEAT